MWKIIGVLVLTAVFTAGVLFFSQDVPPDSGFYPFRRISEKLLLQTQRTPLEKSAYYRHLLDQRLEDIRSMFLNSLAKDKTKNNDRLSSSLRYSTTAGEVTMLVNSNDLREEKLLLRKQFQSHRIIFEKMLNTYTGHDRKYLEDNINYLTQYQKDLE